MQKVHMKFTGKNLTGNAGLTHPGRFAQKLGLKNILEETLTLQRAANARYHVADVIIMVMPGVLAGAKHMSHLAIKVWARGDSAFFDGALLDLLEGRHCYYVIKVAMKGLGKLLEAHQVFFPHPALKT